MVLTTGHFEKRFKQRVANTKRIQIYAERAFLYGKPLDEIRSRSFAKKLDKKEQESGSFAKIYANCIYWFRGNTAITIYPIPQKCIK